MDIIKKKTYINSISVNQLDHTMSCGKMFPTYINTKCTILLYIWVPSFEDCQVLILKIDQCIVSNVYVVYY